MDYDLPRLFPKVTDQDEIDFIVNTNNLENYKLTREKVQETLLVEGASARKDPLAVGQKRCLVLVRELAPNPDLLPHPRTVDETSFDSQFPWFKRLHKNVLYPLAEFAQRVDNPEDYPTMSELGTYRLDPKYLGPRRMPDPDNIRPLLASLFRSLCEFHQEMKDKIENPSLLEREDIKELAAKAYDANLRICCIKPFNDGSNRVARLVENLLRLNWGLRFKVITAQEKDRYLRDIQSHQDLYYRDS